MCKGVSATVIHMKCVALCGLGVRVLGQCVLRCVCHSHSHEVCGLVWTWGEGVGTVSGHCGRGVSAVGCPPPHPP